MRQSRARGLPLVGVGLVVLAAAGCTAAPAGAGRPAATVSASAGLPAGCVPEGQRSFDFPSDKGINYGQPKTAAGAYVGTQWLRSSAYEGWEAVQPRLQADLGFIASHNLGQVLRVFIGLDQLMISAPDSSFVRFDDQGLQHFSQALDLFDAHHLKMIAVVFDQEESNSPGNFHVEALDGHHAAERDGYLRALNEFLRRFGSRSTVVAWDLFNEPYNSLGREGGLPRPPAPDPVSPNYPDATVHAWIRDLYQTAKCAVPDGWFTVSDTTDLYWHSPPHVALYQDSVDFYDLHVYDDRPKAQEWARSLGKPYILGEVGGDIAHGFNDPALNSRVVAYWLANERALGITAVLAHGAGDAVYSLRTGALTPTGHALAAAR